MQVCLVLACPEPSLKQQGPRCANNKKIKHSISRRWLVMSQTIIWNKTSIPAGVGTEGLPN